MLMSGTSGGVAPTYTIQSGSHVVSTTLLAPIWSAPLRVYPAAAAHGKNLSGDPAHQHLYTRVWVKYPYSTRWGRTR